MRDDKVSEIQEQDLLEFLILVKCEPHGDSTTRLGYGPCKYNILISLIVCSSHDSETILVHFVQSIYHKIFILKSHEQRLL